MEKIMKYKMVPVEDIDELAKAYKLFFEFTESLKIAYPFTVPITGPMWKIINRKYQEIEGPR